MISYASEKYWSYLLIICLIFQDLGLKDLDREKIVLVCQIIRIGE